MRTPHVFVTGGTGLLGREVVPRVLLADPDSTATLLVRGDDDVHVGERRGELERYFSVYWPDLDTSRIDTVRGDVTERRLGLDDETVRGLHHRCTHIIHAAASTRLNLTRSLARRVNLEGTREVLRFARYCYDLERFMHVSTAFVAGDRDGVVHERDLDCGQGHRNEYERSKLEAERHVRRLADRLPMTIVRPSIIVGASSDGHIASFGTIYHPLRYLASGAVNGIDGDLDATLDIIPVDIAAELMVALLTSDRTIGGTYHVVSGAENVVPARWLVDRALPCLSGVTTMRAHPVPGHDGSVLNAFFTYLSGHKIFDDSELRSVLGELPNRRPHPRRYLARLFQFCRATRWGADMPWERVSCGAES